MQGARWIGIGYEPRGSAAGNAELSHAAAQLGRGPNQGYELPRFEGGDERTPIAAGCKDAAQIPAPAGRLVVGDGQARRGGGAMQDAGSERQRE